MSDKQKKELDEKIKKWQRLKDSLDCVVIFFIEQDKQTQKIVIKARVFFYITVTYKVTFNNIFGILSSTQGLPVYMVSAGVLNYKNSKKTTDLALRAIITKLTLKIRQFGYSALHVKLNCSKIQMRTFMYEFKEFVVNYRPCLLLWVDSYTFLPLNGTKMARRVL